MQETTRILVVDQQEDAERIVGELRASGLGLETARVERESDLEAALDEFTPDVVLS